MHRPSTSGPASTTRRELLRTAAASAALAGVPMLLRAQPAPIKIGMSAVTTGRFAYAGLGQVVAARMLFDQVNAAGGIEGRKLELIVRDSRNLPEEAVKNVRGLISSDGCTLVLSESRHRRPPPSTKACATPRRPASSSTPRPRR